MSGFAAPYGQPAQAWQEHQTPDGRSYYYNAATKVTQWTKPEDMMSPAERALASQPWKEYTAEGGRKYWYNTETKQSSWEMPEAYKKALGASSGPSTPVPPTPYAQNGGYPAAGHDQYQHRDTRDTYPESRQLTYGNDSKAQSFVPATNDPEYATPEEAEAAFAKLLKRSGVQPDWTWEQTIKAIARDAQFRAIKNPKDRRDAFEKYCQEMILQDKERAKERLTKLRADFETMLKRHPEITHYTRWKTARPMIEGETIFRSTSDEEERRQLFEEYIIGLKKAHKEQQANLRKSAMDGLIELLPKLNLEAYTRWSDAQSIISSTPSFQENEKYETLSQFDILTAFQNHMKGLERAFIDSKQEEKHRKFRKERIARDGYRSLLDSLRKEGKINAGTKWGQVVPLIENDERYTNMAGQSGSTPRSYFGMWWKRKNGVYEAQETMCSMFLKQDKRFDLTPSSDLEEFLSLMKDDPRTANIDRDTLKLIFDRLREKRASKREDDRQSDRQQRRAMDDLRAYIKRLEPPVTLADTYEKVRPRLLKAEEFQAVSSEEYRRNAFDKHIRRLREKEEADRSHRRHDRGSSEADPSRRERDRSRGERSHRSGGRAARRSRSPEPDAYEADRRKAIAERERNHRKSTMAENLLSSERGRLSPPPPRRDRERDRERERERDLDRPARSRREEESYYDRERRDREDERERQYRRRADRGSYDELPYGDERPATSRRRRQDDEDDYARRDSRDSKRLRRERSRERTPPPRDARHRNKSPAPPAPPLSKDVRSGSEEGEIEE
ncbi:Pre-mRNA-processing protein prp40 [Cladobotryum mycophilum]|uniref:Pre-mRNA-processing protein prp40 n=1 Tax=Cladobotryum mycophilum TaxID=491253 RepID=A0ABR0SE78_9HYPO